MSRARWVWLGWSPDTGSLRFAGPEVHTIPPSASAEATCAEETKSYLSVLAYQPFIPRASNRLLFRTAFPA